VSTSIAHPRDGLRCELRVDRHIVLLRSRAPSWRARRECFDALHAKDASCVHADTLGDTWTWDGTSWTQREVPGPTPRAGTVLARLGANFVLFGGLTRSLELLSDTWTWSGTSWMAQHVVGPRELEISAPLAQLRATVVLFGGQVSIGGPGETWSWNGAGWTEESVQGPAARADASMAALDAVVMLFGGRDYDGEGQYADTWSWNGTTWTQQNVTGPRRRARSVQ
jgi:hypothetical protein